MYPEALSRSEAENNEGSSHGDVEADIQSEIEHLKKPDQANLVLQAVKLDVKCGKKPAIT